MEDPGIAGTIATIAGALLGCYVLWRVARFLIKLGRHIEKHIDDK